MPVLETVSSAVKIGSEIANTIAGISDMAKRRRFEESLALLSNRQQEELNDKLLKANTQTERLQILSSSIVQYAIANETKSSSQNTVMYIIIGVLAMGILSAVIFYKIKTSD